MSWRLRLHNKQSNKSLYHKTSAHLNLFNGRSSTLKADKLLFIWRKMMTNIWKDFKRQVILLFAILTLTTGKMNHWVSVHLQQRVEIVRKIKISAVFLKDWQLIYMFNLLKRILKPYQCHNGQMYFFCTLLMHRLWNRSSQLIWL